METFISVFSVDLSGRAWKINLWNRRKRAAYPASLWCSSPGTAVHLHAIKRRAEFNIKTLNCFYMVTVKKFGFK